jgi:hypothetical protein
MMTVTICVHRSSPLPAVQANMSNPRDARRNAERGAVESIKAEDDALALLKCHFSPLLLLGSPVSIDFDSRIHSQAGYLHNPL